MRTPAIGGIAGKGVASGEGASDIGEPLDLGRDGRLGSVAGDKGDVHAFVDDGSAAASQAQPTAAVSPDAKGLQTVGDAIKWMQGHPKEASALAIKPVARPLGYPGQWIRPDDYPPTALRQNRRGQYRIPIVRRQSRQTRRLHDPHIERERHSGRRDMQSDHEACIVFSASRQRGTSDNVDLYEHGSLGSAKGASGPDQSRRHVGLVRCRSERKDRQLRDEHDRRRHVSHRGSGGRTVHDAERYEGQPATDL